MRIRATNLGCYIFTVCLFMYCFFLFRQPKHMREIKSFFISDDIISRKNNDPIRYANGSSEFIDTFCKYRMATHTRPKICLYDLKEDIYVSHNIANGKLWDDKGVRGVLHHIKLLQDSGETVVFIDLGANIGDFTLPVLAQGVETISVEPLDSAMERLATSIVLNKFTDLSHVIRAGISDRRGCISSVENKQNKGGSEITETNCKEKKGLKSITLDDLIPLLPEQKHRVIIKMDIQKYEPYAILGGNELLSRSDIPLIYMEWAEMKQALSDPSKAAKGYVQRVEKAMEILMAKHGMSVYSHDGKQELLWADKLSWSNNIFLARPQNWHGTP